MMTYCVSDNHADFGLFLKLLDEIKLSNSDKLIICGDLIDKGPDSARLLKYISQMPNAEVIIGNHEYTFLKLYAGLMRESPEDFGCVLQKLREYFPNDGYLLDWETVDWLESRPYYIEEEDFICVHVGVPLDGNNRILPLERQRGNNSSMTETLKTRTWKSRTASACYLGIRRPAIC